jgi:hypothetical protein
VLKRVSLTVALALPGATSCVVANNIWEDIFETGKEILEHLNPMEGVSAVGSAFTTYAFLRKLCDDRGGESVQDFLRSEFGKKCATCGICLATFSYFSLHWEQHLVNLSGVLGGFLMHEITKDLFPDIVSLVATVASCFVASVCAKHVFSSLLKKQDEKNSKNITINC